MAKSKFLGLQKYGRYWRGLEAPRHICLPTIQGLVEYIEVKYPQQYTVIDKSRNWLSSAIVMYVESKSAKEGRGAKVNLRPFIAEVFRHSIRRALRTVPVDSSELLHTNCKEELLIHAPLSANYLIILTRKEFCYLFFSDKSFSCVC